MNTEEKCPVRHETKPSTSPPTILPLGMLACRYAFSGKPDVNLVNQDNLPAYPFRTGDWPE